MKIKDYLGMAIPSDRIIITSGKEELYKGYVALMEDPELFEKDIKRVGVFPIITAKESGEPVRDTHTYSCTDLDIKVFVRIEI